MTFQLANNASSTLLDALPSTADVLVIQVADAAKFPTITGSGYFMVTLEDTTQNPVLREVVQVTETFSNTFTVMRAQEGFAASAFSAGATVSNRITAGTIIALYNATGQAVQYYLGAQDADPTTTPSGGALVTGMLYFNIVLGALKEYNGSAWIEISSGSTPTTGSTYLGAFSSAPTSGPGGAALVVGDLYYDLTQKGLFEYLSSGWATAGSTTITGTTTFVGNVIMNQNLSTVGTTTLIGPTNTESLSVTGTETVDGSLTVIGSASVSNTFSVGSSSVNGTLYYNGLPVITSANLSGTHNSQGWPDGGTEYWGQGQTSSGGTANIEFPAPFSIGVDYADACVYAPILADAGPNAAQTGNATSSGMTVLTFNTTNGEPAGNVAFYWRVRGH